MLPPGQHEEGVADRERERLALDLEDPRALDDIQLVLAVRRLVGDPLRRGQARGIFLYWNASTSSPSSCISL
ncbi:MAG TPA: hypothetical protein VF576_00640 [Rubricoccaceae bacterium]